MASIYQLKTSFQRILRPIVKFIARYGVTANQITVLACILSIGMGSCFFYFQPRPVFYWVIPVFLFVRMALNAIDGLLAREHAMQSSLGALLNEMTDVISDAFLYYPLAFNWGLNAHLNVLFILFSTLTEMTGVVGIQVGASRRYDGPMGKSDRAFVMGLLAILYAVGLQLSNWINLLFAGLIGLLALTVYNRAVQAIKSKP
jgi:CDP-diacylglycerol---glycerol-3-phosphate 3-phosphatidyltransferase